MTRSGREEWHLFQPDRPTSTLRVDFQSLSTFLLNFCLLFVFALSLKKILNSYFLIVNVFRFEIINDKSLISLSSFVCEQTNFFKNNFVRFVHWAALSCSLSVYRLGGIGFGSGMAGRPGRALCSAWVVCGWCMGAFCIFPPPTTHHQAMHHHTPLFHLLGPVASVQLPFLSFFLSKLMSISDAC